MGSHLPNIKVRLSIHAHRKVRGLLDGEYAAMHTGRSMDFNDLREYVRGDDVKDVDWKASARTRTVLVKRYTATRKHTVLLACSTGRSMAAMNDQQISKRQLAVFVAGVMGQTATRNGDLVALVAGDSDEVFARPASGSELKLEASLAAIHDAITPAAPHSDLVRVLRHAATTFRRRAILVVICDEFRVSPELAAALRRLVVQHEVLVVTIGDLDPVRASTTQRLVDIDSGVEVPDWLRHDAQLQAEYAQAQQADDQAMKHAMDELGIVHERVHNYDSAITAVYRLLERHRHARRK